MASLLDFKNWKIESADGKKAVLKHSDGHTMNIAIRALPKIQQEQIKRLNMAKGGKVQRLAEGSPEDSVPRPDPAPTPGDDVSHDTHITINAAAPAPAPAPTPAPVAAPVVQNNPQLVDNQAARAPAVAAAPAPAGPADRGLMLSDQTLNAPAAVGLQQKAIGEQQAVDTAKGKQTAVLEDAYVKEREALAARDQQNYQELKSHADDFANYQRANPINPRAYQENMSTPQKVSTAIGLLFGGFKQGYAGGNNPAMDFLNKQIDRDIEAQKSRSDQQKTVYGAYEHLYGDANIATNLAKVSANDMLVHKASLMAAQLGTPQAKATADALQAQKGIENNQLLLESAGRLGTLRTGGGAPRSNQPRVAGATPAAQKNENGLGQVQPILHAGAQHIFEGLQFNPNAKPDYEDAKKQFTIAQQADKALANLGPSFDTMEKNRTYWGRVAQRAENFGHIPVLGQFVEGAARAGANEQYQTRIYNSAKTALLSDLTNAFKGTNVSGEDIAKVVHDNSPVQGDGPEELKQKRDAIEGFIRRSVPTSLLQKYHLSSE